MLASKKSEVSDFTDPDQKIAYGQYLLNEEHELPHITKFHYVMWRFTYLANVNVIAHIV